MKNKISIYLNMIIICLSLCVISVGVHSLTSANLTISGSLGYVYHDKSPYTITATIQNYTITEGGTLQTSAISTPLTIGEAESNTTAGSEITKISLTDKIYFKGTGYDLGNNIEILVKVKNNEDTQKAVVLLFDDITGLGYTRKVASGAVTTPTSITDNHSEAIILSKGDQTTFRLTLKQSTKKTNLSIAKSDFNIQLSVADYNESNFTASQTDTTTTTGIKYTLNSDLKSWSVAKNGASGDVTFEPIIQGLPVNTIAEKGFYDLSYNASIKIANSVTDVLERGLDGDAWAYTVYIPGSVINVGYAAFDGSYPLTLSSNNIFNLTTLGGYSFSGGGGLSNTTFTIEIQNNGLMDIPGNCFRCLNASEIIIHPSVTTMGDYAIYNSSSLANVIFIGTTPPTFGTAVFYSCTSLTNIYVPSDSVNAYKTALAGLTTYNTSSGSTISVSDLVTAIPDSWDDV